MYVFGLSASLRVVEKLPSLAVEKLIDLFGLIVLLFSLLAIALIDLHAIKKRDVPSDNLVRRLADAWPERALFVVNLFRELLLSHLLLLSVFVELIENGALNAVFIFEP